MFLDISYRLVTTTTHKLTQRRNKNNSSSRKLETTVFLFTLLRLSSRKHELSLALIEWKNRLAYRLKMKIGLKKKNIS